MKNCLSCKLFVGCKDPKKGFGYICKKYEKSKATGSGFQTLESGLIVPESSRSEKLTISSSKGRIDSSQKRILSVADKSVDLDDDEDVGPETELDLGRMMRRVLKGKALPDYRVDDRDLKEFPNFWSFCIAREGLNTRPFARQFWTLTQVLGDACPTCSNPKWQDIKNIPVGADPYDLIDRKFVVLMKFGKCQKCGGRKSKFFRQKKMNLYTELDACIGQRAGKSTTLSMLCSYLSMKLLKLQKPTVVYGLLRDSMIGGVFIGLTFAKAVSTLWNPYRNMMSSCQWIQDYHKMLDFYGEKHGEELYKFGEVMIQYKHRNLLFTPSGPNRRTLRGDTRIWSIIDEIGLFSNEEGDDNRERQSANEVYTSCESSLGTIQQAAENLLREGYDNIITSFMGCISSPMSPRDKIMMLVKLNENSRDALTLHLPTWHFNPNMPRNCSFIKKKYRADPIKAERDFGAMPSLNESPFFNNIESLAKGFGPLGNKVKYQYLVYDNPRTSQQFKWARLDTVHARGEMPPTIMGFDAGYASNSFAITIGHVSMAYGKARYFIDLVLEIAPNFKKNVLHYSKIFTEVIVPLVKAFNVKCVVSDRWQNIKTMHDLITMFPFMVHTEYRLSYDDLCAARDYLQDEDHRVILPKLEIPMKKIQTLDVTTSYPHCFKYMPVAHLMFQMMTVQDTGNQVVKGPNLTDDVWRSTALLLAFLMDEEYVREHLVGTQRTRGMVGFVGSARGGSPISVMLGIGPPATQAAGLQAHQQGVGNKTHLTSTVSGIAVRASRNKV